MPTLADHDSHEQWFAGGAKDANARGLERAWALLEAYQPPPLDAAVREELRDFIRQREAELAERVS